MQPKFKVITGTLGPTPEQIKKMKEQYERDVAKEQRVDKVNASQDR